MICISLSLFLMLPHICTAAENIQLQLKWKHQFQFAGIYMALEKGYYQQSDLNVWLVEGGPNTSPINHVLKGEAHYAVSDTGALIARSQGKRIKVLAAIFQHSPLALLVKQSSNIKTLQDLRNKRIMIQTGYQNADVLAALHQVGLSEKDFIRQDISYNIQDLIQGKTDAFCAYLTDQPHQLDLLGIPYKLFYPKDYGFDFYGDTLISSEHEVVNHPERVDAFVKATIKGWQYALDHPDEAIDLILKKYNTQHFSREQLQFEALKTAQLIMPNIVNIGYMHINRWQRIAQTYAEQQLITADFPIQQLLYQPQKSQHKIITFISTYLWQSIALFTLLLLGIHILSLRRAVLLRTHKLKESKIRYRTLMDTLPIGIGLYADGKWTYLNRALLNMFAAKTFKEVLGNDMMQSIHPDSRKNIVRQQQYQGDNPTLFEEKLYRIDGSYFDAEIMLKAMKIGEQSPFMIIAHDISEYKKAQKEKLILQRQVEHTQRLEALAILAGGIAHDFNNILMAIMGNVSLATLSLDDDAPSMKYLNLVEKSSCRAADLCKQMLAYSGRGHFLITPTDLSSLVANMHELLQATVKKNITIQLNLTPNLAAIEADSTQLQQVIMHLVLNANEAIKKHGGEIHITTGHIHVDKAYHASTCMHGECKQGHYIYLEIRDTGCGMNHDTMGKIFDPFFTTKFTGRGLGMSAVLGIVRGHHASIHIKSHMQEGSSFRILFPISTQALDDTKHSIHPQKNHEQYGTILIIDDDESILQVTANMLEKIGYNTQIAHSGQQGLDLLQENKGKIHAIILDMTMPHMDGAQTFQEILKIDKHAKVILASGYDDHEVTSHTAFQELSGFIQKPYDVKTLHQRIQTIIQENNLNE